MIQLFSLLIRSDDLTVQKAPLAKNKPNQLIIVLGLDQISGSGTPITTAN